ncbi:SCO family protein [Devosia sp. MC532]|uniref:SCO family protein n=1 Tax=Devosia sp. MC532 TaxID=2799788 RepID=UPI0018F737A9|nr:SCO family protein [Devosia sp. MC532]MBJ7577431.1 SCO family protein [Devosia sp. MC532]
MSRMKNIRVLLWALVGTAALTATGLYVYNANRPAVTASFGAGDYTLEAGNGDKFTYASLSGNPSMLFFGFTHCPDVCPTTLAEMTSWYEVLGPEAKDLKAYFVTVDPERDTPQVVADYVSWAEPVVGLSGSLEEIDTFAKAWGAFYEKSPLDNGDYTMNHTASVYLINANGEFEGTIAYEEGGATAIGKLKKLLAKG